LVCKKHGPNEVATDMTQPSLIDKSVVTRHGRTDPHDYMSGIFASYDPTGPGEFASDAGM